MLDRLIELDQQLTLAINGLHSPATDHFWLMFSDRWVWVPFYAILIFLIIKRLGWKRGLILILAVVLCLVLSDQISTAIKRSVRRLRPSYTTWMLEGGLHIPEPGRGGYYGFFSSHASNAFMLVTCILTGLRSIKGCRYKDIAGIGFTWATLVSVSRIMMGRHYLGDILVGAVFGALLGWGIGLLARILIKRVSPSPSGSRGTP